MKVNTLGIPDVNGQVEATEPPNIEFPIFDGVTWSSNQSRYSEYEQFLNTPVESVVIPSVSPRQIRQALTRAGLRATVEAAVAAGDQDTKDWWEFSTVFERSNPVVLAMGTALSVSEKQIDDLWILAGTL